MKKFLKDLLSEDSQVSSKRFIALCGFFFLVVTMLINSFSDINKAPAESLVDAVQIITIIAIGGSTADRFTNKKVNDSLNK